MGVISPLPKNLHQTSEDDPNAHSIHDFPQVPAHIRVGNGRSPGQALRPDLGCSAGRGPERRPNEPRGLRDCGHQEPDNGNRGNHHQVKPELRRDRPRRDAPDRVHRRQLRHRWQLLRRYRPRQPAVAGHQQRRIDCSGGTGAAAHRTPGAPPAPATRA